MFLVSLEGFAISDCRVEFYVKNRVYILLETFGNPKFGQNIAKTVSETVCLLIRSWGYSRSVQCTVTNLFIHLSVHSSFVCLSVSLSLHPSLSLSALQPRPLP